MIIVAVIAAGALGAVLRWLVSVAASRRVKNGTAASRDFPLAVLIVNVVGSAVGGAALGLATAGGLSSDLRLIVLTGFCGGLTTFSTFSVETIQLIIDGRWRAAVISVSANLVLGIAAAALAFGIVVAQA